MLSEWMKTNYVKRYCGQPLEINEEVADKSRWIDGVEGDAMKLACRNWRSDAQDRGRWRHLLDEGKAHPGL
jgi:hypothetical protein